jgi:hypothetical protein
VFTPGGERRGEHYPRGARGEVNNGPQLGLNFLEEAKVQFLKVLGAKLAPTENFAPSSQLSWRLHAS